MAFTEYTTAEQWHKTLMGYSREQLIEIIYGTNKVLRSMQIEINELKRQKEATNEKT